MNMRNAALSVLFCLLLSGPIFMGCVEKAGGLQLPEWMTSESAAYLSGGVSEANMDQYLSLDGFISHDLQESLEASVGNSIPFKATALLANAELQRTAIDLSNRLCRFSCYPTFFGSDYLFVPQEDAVVAKPLAADKARSNALQRFGGDLGSFIERHPDLKCAVYVADISNTSSANPACSLVSSSFSTDKAAEEIRIGTSSDILVVTSDAGWSLSSYYQYFFRSDHHWNARGAALAYRDISQSLDVPEMGFAFKAVEGPSYSGAYSRNSLCIVEDVPFDIDFDFGQETMDATYGQVDGNQHIAYDEASEQAKHWQFYDLFYELFPHTRGIGTGNALLISDSFGGALVRPLGLTFENVWVRNTLHVSSRTDDKLSDIVDSCDIDTVIFVGHATNYGSFQARNPHFFE